MTVNDWDYVADLVSDSLDYVPYVVKTRMEEDEDLCITQYGRQLGHKIEMS